MDVFNIESELSLLYQELHRWIGEEKFEKIRNLRTEINCEVELLENNTE